jgi:hypothetical protein
VASGVGAVFCRHALFMVMLSGVIHAAILL